MNLAHLLDATAERTPDAAAITFEGVSTTYAGLAEQARSAAARLKDAGVGKGDRVALWLPNHPAFASAMYAVWRLGAIVVPVHAALTKPEAKHVLSDAGVKAMFCGQDQVAAGAEELEHELDIVGFFLPDDAPGSAAADPVGETGDALPIVDVGDDDLALIAYTAGTSGLPKGAMLTHGNLRANLEQMRASPVAIREDDVVLCILPLFHIFGLNVVLNLAVDLGARIVLFERFDPVGSMEAVEAEGITVITGAPPAFVAWLGVGGGGSGSLPRSDGGSGGLPRSDERSDTFSSVRVAVSGAAPLPKEVLNGFAERFGVTIWEGYGLTETAPALTSTAVGGVAKPGSIGRPLPNVEIRLLDEEGDEVEEGDPGEVVVRGPNVFKGYWNKPDETSRVLKDGWFYSGDVAVMDDDGDLYIVDRRRDMVLVSGFNVYPREVEDVLRRHPNVGDVAVVGEPDPESGEAVRAIVVADPPGERVSPDDLIEFCRKSLAPYKIPSTIEVVTEIPRNAAGKVLRRVLRHT